MMHPTIDIKTFLKPGVRAHLAGIGGVSMCPLAEVLLGRYGTGHRERSDAQKHFFQVCHCFFKF